MGRHRKENQDSGYASDGLLVIADGVGGAAYGDVASATAVHLIADSTSCPSPPGEEMLTALAGAVHRVHDKLAEMVEQDDELDGTSTTVTAALLDGHVRSASRTSATAAPTSCATAARADHRTTTRSCRP